MELQRQTIIRKQESHAYWNKNKRKYITNSCVFFFTFLLFGIFSHFRNEKKIEIIEWKNKYTHME